MFRDATSAASASAASLSRKKLSATKLTPWSSILPFHAARTRSKAGHVSSTCRGVMLMRCVRSADVPCAKAQRSEKSMRRATSSSSHRAASRAVERSAPEREPYLLRERSQVWDLSVFVLFLGGGGG